MICANKREEEEQTYRIPIRNNRPLPSHNLQIILKLILTRAIKHNINPHPTSNLLNLPNKITFLFIIHHKLRPIHLRKLNLLTRTRRPNNPRTNSPQQLTEPQPHTPRRSMHEHPVALLDLVRLADERQGRETLQDRGGCHAGLEGRGDNVGFGSGRRGVFGVGAGPEPDYAVADLEVEEVAAGSEGDDGAFCFAAEDLGFGCWVETCAEVARYPCLRQHLCST